MIGASDRLPMMDWLRGLAAMWVAVTAKQGVTAFVRRLISAQA